jgi:hypothetical protein
VACHYVGSAQYHSDRIADLEAGNTEGLVVEQVAALLRGHRIALRAQEAEWSQ